MVQKEVAERMVAVPGHKIYGALSVSVQYYTEPKMLFEISPKCFMPAPEVTSAVVAMDVRKNPPVELTDEKTVLLGRQSGLSAAAENLVQCLEEYGHDQGTDRQGLGSSIDRRSAPR